MGNDWEKFDTTSIVLVFRIGVPSQELVGLLSDGVIDVALEGEVGIEG